jgi:cellulose synthase/poly-beta-1,6-N-acetylglucosamine synthase-like glycosyltransferase
MDNITGIHCNETSIHDMLKAVYLPSYLSLRIPVYLILTLHEPRVLFRLPYFTYILVLWIYITVLVCLVKRRKIAFLGFLP